ncbi:BatA domain-containing protein [Hymenobacter psychrophilus]|uniref:N-terminal double-transmembrane domain-containing protein n=1 Tax=Hymenobacter psychrophilus TaxID=651662 RepID=A0A1H3JFV0_9BACT|nr:BatA domain-containing protein [Hymenobacter psychrophilus]SDY38782.1 N-terminal double-transmembrane domain-containing protein [Hymenobacter psychrophilus]
MPSIFFPHAAAGWLALLGLAVPLAIYLWNRRPGRVVRVGSVRWLQAAANQRLRNIKPEQLLLFLLRAAVLGLLALAVAEPQQLLPVPAAHGQVLLAPGVTAEALAPVRPLLDSLRQRGYELRQLSDVRPVSAVRPWAALGLGADTTGPAPVRLTTDTVLAPAPNLWNAVQLAADSLPGRPLVVVAPLSVASFRGTRPTLPAAVRWLPLPPPDSSRWPVAAWRIHPDSLIVRVANGSELAIAYQQIRVRQPAAGQPLGGNWGGAEIRLSSPNTLLVTENGARRTLPLLNRAPRWHLSHDAAHAASARVLAAALRAVAPTLPLQPRLVVSTSEVMPPDSLDWLFWLRDAPLPARWATDPTVHVWQEAGSSTRPFATGFQSAASSGTSSIFRLDTASGAGAVPVWMTAAGRPLLRLQRPGRYRLHTRLDAPWSTLAELPELPALLLPLLLPPAPATFQPDSRQLALSQLQTPVAAAANGLEPAAPRRPLAPWLVLVAGGLFGLERLLAARRNRSVLAAMPAPKSSTAQRQSA